jgi:Ca-activated chloride channel homolog
VRHAARLLTVFLMVSTVAFATAQGGGPERTNILLVLDASGSMYLRLEDGRYRITAAKEALTEFVTRMPAAPDLHVGLRVYGSQVAALDEGACEDSVLTVPVAGFDREHLLQEIRDAQAMGATPIAFSLERAAEDLRHEAGRRLIVLVTDGAESCGGDLRAVAERLTGEGFDIDLRIIGLALSEGAVRSFERIGTFENTESAAELAAALGRAVDIAAATEAHHVRVTLTRRGEPAVDGATVRFVDGVSGDVFDFALDAPGTFTRDLPAGSYRAEVADAFASAPLSVAGIAIAADGENAFAFELEPEAEVALFVTPTDPVAGATVSVRFEGAPSGERNWLTIAPVDATDEVYLDWSTVRGAAGEVTLRVPDEVVELEARYHVHLPEGGSRVVGRSAPFTARAVTASVTAPGEMPAGSAFEVVWQGPDNQGDYLTIVPEGAEDHSWTSYAYTASGSPASLTAPIEAGRYEVRYVTGQAGTVLARQSVVLSALTASVRPPPEVAAGAAFEVAWQGPDNARDYLTIVPAGEREGAYLSYAYTTSGSPARLTAPSEPGAYEVRYVAGQGDQTLASAPVTVTAVTARVQPPGETVAAGRVFFVDWQGPDNQGDYVTIVPDGAAEGTYVSYAYTRDGSPASLTAPMEPGRYEVRYVTGQGDRTLASAPITVTAVTASVQPLGDAVAAGTAFEVGWQGPDNYGDYLTIVPEGDPEGSYASYAYTRDGSPASLMAPDEPGRYEVRYVSGQGDRTLARAKVVVR